MTEDNKPDIKCSVCENCYESYYYSANIKKNIKTIDTCQNCSSPLREIEEVEYEIFRLVDPEYYDG